MRKHGKVAMVFGALFSGTIVAVLVHAGTMKHPVLSVNIAVPRTDGKHSWMAEAGLRILDLQRDKHFHVIVTNESEEPIRLWETWNSWGYYDLKFEIVDDQGKILTTMERKPGHWPRNFASWAELGPGEHFVIDVQLNQSWKGFPVVNGPGRVEFQWKLRAVYENTQDVHAVREDVWTGRVESSVYDCFIRHDP